MKIEIEVEQDGKRKAFTKEFTRAEVAKKSLAALTAEAVEAVRRENGFPEDAKITVHKKYMTPGYYDSPGNSYDLAERLGSGGEGTVYLIKNSPFVAKIYHEPVTEEKAEKLCWMAANKNDRLLKVAAWVVDVLRDTPGGQVIGFLMPSIRAKEIHELYSLKSRRIYFTEATWHFLVHTAANVARAFYNLHRDGHVMGDVNHGNCVVLADGTVKLIDCDSYSIKTDKMRYPCEVGVATHLAPELHGADLGEIERTPAQDNFGMAVIIFQLLFLGRHPFAGNYLGAEDKSIEDCIREYRFAYGPGAARRNVAQPPATLQLEAVSPRVAELFERAFTSKDNRPEPREWIEALEDLAENLEQCPEHPGHVFYEKYPFCPWCEIEIQTGIMIFPFVMAGAGLKGKDKKDFDINHVENLLTGFKVNNLPAKLKDTVSLAQTYLQPSAQIIEKHQKQRNEQIIIVAVYFVALFSATLIIGSGCAFVIGIIALIIMYSKFGDLGKTIRSDERERLEKAQNKWHKLENDWTRLVNVSDFDRNMLTAINRVGTYKRLQSDSAEESDAEKLPAIEKNIAPPEAKEAEKRGLETEIGNLLAALRVGSVRIGRFQKQLQTQTQAVAKELAQAESNVKFLGSNLPIGIILVLITIGTPIFSAAVRGGFSSSPKTVYTSYPPNYNVMTNTYPPPPIAQKTGVFVPEESITNRQIEALSSAERTDIVFELMRLADLESADLDYKTAEKKLRFALRFDDKNTQLLTKLGIVLYEQKKYNDSFVYLNKSKSLNEAKNIADNDEADFYIGMNYLRLKKYSQAKDIFLRLSNGKMRDNPTFYNLGSAYMGLKEYSPAIGAFQKALSFEPNDIESTYQMGICYSKLGDTEQVKNFYLALSEKDRNRAEKFRKAVGKSFDLGTPTGVFKIDEPSAPPPPPRLQTVPQGTGTGTGSGN